MSLKKGETDKRRKLDESNEEWENRKAERKTERIEPIDEHKEIELMRGDLSRTTQIGSRMARDLETLIIAFLRSNVDMFAWDPLDFKGIS